MERVNGEFRVMPIDQRVVKAHLQALCPKSLHILLHQISAKGSIGDLEVGILAIEHTEAFVVLGG